MQEVAAAQFSAIALAERGTGEPIGERSAACLQQKHKRQETLQRPWVDVGLTGRVAPVANAAPISDGKMTVAVLHRKTVRISEPPLRCCPKTGRQCGFV